MHYVSEEGERLMFKLIAWELLDRADYNPKDLLRSLSLTDLVTISENIRQLRGEEFLSVQMVKAEMLYRAGQLKDDWTVGKEGLHFTPEPFLYNSKWMGATA